MAINKTINKRTNTHGAMRNCIEYVLRQDKTSELLTYVTSPYCRDEINYDLVYRTFLEEKKMWDKDSGRMYAHNIISWHKDEQITPEQALEFGKEFAENWFSGFQTLVAVHKDKDHIHCHLVTNSVSYEDGRKLHNTKKDLERMKQLTNQMCRERGLTVAEKGKHFDESQIEKGEVIAWSKDKYNLFRQQVKDSFVADCAMAVLKALENCISTIAVRRMIDGYLKLMYPNGEFTKEELEEIIQIALEMRRRVKEQLKKLGGMEFYDVNFSYIDLEDMSEHYVSVPEQGGGKLIPDGMCNPGQVYTVSRGKSGMIGVFRLESQMLPGNGKIERTGLGSDSKCKEAVNTAFNYLKANGNRISGSISTSTKDYIINYQDLQGIGMTDKLALPTLIALCSIALGKPVVSNLAVLGDITISGTMIKVDELANTLQVCLDSGAKKVLIPSTSFVDFASVPAELMSAFQLIPYQSAEDAVFKALGVE